MIALQNIVLRFDKVAFLIGNGPNLAANIMPAWFYLIKSAADRPINFETKGLSNTEVYDLVELSCEDYTKVKERVCNCLKIKPSYQLNIHKRLMEFASNNSCPVLTTNFDEAFEHSVDAQLFHIDSKG